MIWAGLVLFIIFLSFGLAVFRGSPYVPSHKSDIVQALNELYNLNSKDVLVDIGSGDGIVLREAAKLGSHAVGYEINPTLVLISRFLSRKYKKVSIVLADFWFLHLPGDTTVVYIFSATRDIKKITLWMQHETNRLGRTIHLISYGAKMGDKKVVKNLGAYYLYAFSPLQPDKAQV